MHDLTPGQHTPDGQTEKQNQDGPERGFQTAENSSSAAPDIPMPPAAPIESAPPAAPVATAAVAADEQLLVERPCAEAVVPAYALLFFDHLYSEYLVLKPLINDAKVIAMLDGVVEKRRACRLGWSDVYSFDLALVRVRPPISLIRKAYDARARYRSFAGQKEYDEYVASNPPNLVEIKVAPGAQPPQPDEIVENALRADVEYLLNKFYLYYATLPARESLRDELTRRAVRRTLLVVGALCVLMLLNLGVISLFKSFGKLFDAGAAARPGLTLLTVALAGIVGGCVSTLQRIQSAPSEGDALFNLAALNNGWTGLSLSPLYGGIFAALLFVLFAAGILRGSVFPEIHTPAKRVPANVVAKPSSPPSTQPVTTATPTPIVSSSPAAGSSPTAGAAVATPTPEKDEAIGGESSHAEPPVVETDSNSILRVKTFLEETGPVDGVSYALLIVWSFLAGFAERLVPDTLNRLVAKNEAIQGQ
jgi:hypothetical protein